MTDKRIGTITHIESMRKKKATIGRIQAHLRKSADVDEVLSMENLEKNSRWYECQKSDGLWKWSLKS